VANAITGSSTYYAGGGAAGTDHSVSLAGGLGGGHDWPETSGPETPYDRARFEDIARIDGPFTQEGRQGMAAERGAILESGLEVVVESVEHAHGAPAAHGHLEGTPALGQRDRPTELAKPHEQVVPIQSRSIQQALDQRRAASTHMVVRHARMQSDLRGAGEAPQQLDVLP
jgi:hypothetical protein